MKKGFTLLELMIVVAIVGMLAAIAIPRLSRAGIRATAWEQLENEGVEKITEKMIKERIEKITKENENKKIKNKISRKRDVKTEFEKDFGRY